MQPLKILNHVQKARLLHSLFIHEIPGFLEHLKAMTEKILSSRSEVAELWKDQLFGVDFWFELAENTGNITGRYHRDMLRSSSVFAEQLFGGYNAVFTIHALTVYVTEERYSDPKFRSAVDLLFS